MGEHGLIHAIPFTMTETKMNIRVYSPNTGIPVRLKVEDASNGTISVETEDTTTVANTWETLEFDFSNHAMGTSALDTANTYNKISVFFHFGTNGAGIGADSVYYYDDVKFGPSTVGIDMLKEYGLVYYPNPVQNQLVLRADYSIDELSLLNQMGQQIVNRKVNSYEEKLDMSNLTPGVYFVRVTIGKQVGTFKVLKY